MNRMIWVLAVLGLLVSLRSWAQDSTKPELSKAHDASLAERFRILKKEYQSGSDSLTEQERAVKDRSVAALLDAVKANPKDPCAEEILVWSCENTRQSRERALVLLAEHHPQSEAFERLARSLVYLPRDEERLLRKVLKANPHRAAQGIAMYGLAEVLDYYASEVQLTDATKAASMRQEVEALLKSAQDKYGDVRMPDGQNLGVAARTFLATHEKFGIGKLALDIEGEDSDGKRFKLSDYKGKVLVLDFWASW